MQDHVYEMLEGQSAGHWWYRARDEIIAHLIAGLDLPPDPLVLEMGAGTGHFLDQLPFRRKVGLDIHRFDAWAGSSAAMIQADAMRPPIRPGSVDLLLVLEMLEHVADDQAVMDACLAMLRPGGTLLLMAPAFPILWSALDEVGMHYRRYRLRDLRRLVAAADPGARIVHQTHLNTVLFPPILAARLLERAAKGLGLVGGERAVGLDPPAAPVNDLLRRLFLLEKPLVPRLRLPFGVSLLAVIRKEGPR